MISTKQVTVIDYGVGNLLSVQRSLEYCGAEVILTSDPKKILTAKRIVLPGVGAFSNAMEALDRLSLIDIICEVSLQETPLLAICLGMQLLFEESDEFGITEGLGLLPGRVIAIPKKTLLDKKQKVPHIGWSSLHQYTPERNWNNTLLQDNNLDEAVYFVHSFMTVPTNEQDNIAYCKYGGHKITAAIKRNNITGCQFHPEKSGEAGLKILRRFLM